MNAVDEYLQWNSEKERKLRFVSSKNGAADVVVKRVEKSLRGVYEQLRFLRYSHLPMICSIEEQEDCLEVAEQYINGRSLQYIFDEQGAQDDAFVLRLARQMAETLKLLHGMSPAVIHRDIKPQNIMLRGDDFVLIDFDAARWFDKNARKDTTAIGTQGYAAPEQYGFAQTDARSDIFSLGVTLYEMRMGQPYHKGAACNGILRKVVAKCTQFDADKRYQNADELLKAITKTSRQRSKPKLVWYSTLIATVICILHVVVLTDTKSKSLSISQNAPSGSLLTTTQPLPTQYGGSPSISPTISIMQAAAAPISSHEICTCRLNSVAKMEDEGAIFTPVEIGIDEARVGTSQVCIRLPVDSSACTASKHNKQKVTYKLSEVSLAHGATMDEYDVITVRKPGAYTIFYTAELNGQISKGYYRFYAHDEITGENELNSHAQGCTCKLIEPADVRDASTIFRPNKKIIVRDQPVSAEVYVHYSVDSSGCTAKVHSDQVVTYELADESIGLGATLDGNIITVDTPGLYHVYYTIEFNGKGYQSEFGFGIDG